MRAKGLLAAFLLGMGLCFASTLGCDGEIIRGKGLEPPDVGPYLERYPDDLQRALNEWKRDCDLKYPTWLDFRLLEARVYYMMRNPTSFTDVYAGYDDEGISGILHGLPRNVKTQGKVVLVFYDVREAFSGQSGTALLESFKLELELFYSYMNAHVTNMDLDIVAMFKSKHGIPLGYFYLGEYHLWEK